MEIEIKYKVSQPDFKKIAMKLRQLGAHHLYDKKEVDIYFNVAGRDSISSKECLRIRESSSHTELTYKAPSKNPKEKHFAKRELNVDVKDAKATHAILEAMGNRKLVTIKKHRRYFKFAGCVVTLDRIDGAGTFIEVEYEGRSKKSGLEIVMKCSEKLGLREKKIDNRPYRDILLEKRQKNNPRPRILDQG